MERRIRLPGRCAFCFFLSGIHVFSFGQVIFVDDGYDALFEQRGLVWLRFDVEGRIAERWSAYWG